MGIMEFSNLESFKKVVIKQDKARYCLITTELDEAICKPTVTSRGLDTFYIRNLTKEQLSVIIKTWGEGVINISRFWWSEDKQPGREYV